MAVKPNNYNKAPWPMKRGAFEQFVLVTADNRKNAIVLGRVLYSIIDEGGPIQYCGSFTIWPQMQKGMIRVTGHPFTDFKSDIFVDDEPLESYAKSYKSVIDHLIAKKRLYVKPTDQIVKFFKV
jgi:hypothetical protein